MEKWREPDIRPSFQQYGVKDRYWINGRVQNLPFTNCVERVFIGQRREIKRLELNIAITRETPLEKGRKLLTPIIWDMDTRHIFYNDSPDITHKFIYSLPASPKLAVETKILDISQGKVNVYKEDGVDKIELSEGKYELQMQIRADGRIIDVARWFQITNGHPYFEWMSEQCQSEK